MKTTHVRATALAAACTTLLTVGIATAGPRATRAATTVTIQVEGRDFSGTVSSPRPLKCAKDRKIILFKQVGTEQDPSVDTKVASDLASLSGDQYVWNTGNTGIKGKFYARAKRTIDCKADSSETLHTTS
jgi:hypothetical protein